MFGQVLHDFATEEAGVELICSLRTPLSWMRKTALWPSCYMSTTVSLQTTKARATKMRATKPRSTTATTTKITASTTVTNTTSTPKANLLRMDPALRTAAARGQATPTRTTEVKSPRQHVRGRAFPKRTALAQAPLWQRVRVPPTAHVVFCHEILKRDLALPCWSIFAGLKSSRGSSRNY
ncbi:unnamed protein product [Laminaria digitata]